MRRCGQRVTAVTGHDVRREAAGGGCRERAAGPALICHAATSFADKPAIPAGCNLALPRCGAAFAGRPARRTAWAAGCAGGSGRGDRSRGVTGPRPGGDLNRVNARHAGPVTTRRQRVGAATGVIILVLPAVWATVSSLTWLAHVERRIAGSVAVRVLGRSVASPRSRPSSVLMSVGCRRSRIAVRIRGECGTIRWG